VNQITRLNKAPPPFTSPRNRITKKSSQVRERSLKRRGTEKTKTTSKLLETLGDLLDALPSTSGINHEEIHNVNMEDEETNSKPTLMSKTEQVRKYRAVAPKKSLRSRPGAQKKRALVEKSEKERFGLNLAILASLPTTTEVAMEVDQFKSSPAANDIEPDTATTRTPMEHSGSSEKWAALRKHISLSLNGSGT
jgi:hypothetical protein